MTPAETAHLEAWKKGSLAQATTELFEMSEAYRDRPLAEFNLLTGTIANEARKGFQEQFGITSVAQFNHMNIKLKNAYIQLIVAALNDALPLDYPHYCSPSLLRADAADPHVLNGAQRHSRSARSHDPRRSPYSLHQKQDTRRNGGISVHRRRCRVHLSIVATLVAYQHNRKL
ncbi:MAG: hypothetical protein Q8R30_02985 [bacterium]|nr:hypothetical protein [bacterium]